ncbi:polysaccharide pyruvyl transferase family protein [Lentisalinibacter sediminis]|uniref:polysaccharide pyruvyl transferase family protein n=1 Tax=Lentisalinibacter sediminis TaxID=2992237 RepID=UPI0038677FC5
MFKRRKRILLLADVHGFGRDYHVGDEAMAEVAIKRISELIGRDRIVLAAGDRRRASSTYSVTAFSFYHVSDRAWRAMRVKRPARWAWSYIRQIYWLLSCDSVLICGGGNLTSVYPNVLEARLRFLELARRLRRRLFFVSQTLGPYSQGDRARVRLLLRDADWIGVRDPGFSEAQIGMQARPALDDAVYLQPEFSESVDEMSGGKRFAIFTYRRLDGMSEEDVASLAGASERVAKEREMEGLLVPHHAPQGGGDLNLAREVSAFLSANATFSIAPIMRAAEVKALTQRAQLVVTMRYHQLIFALSAGIPVVAIWGSEYTKGKLGGAFEMMNLEPCMLPIDRIGKDLDDMVDFVWEQREQFRDAASSAPRNGRTRNEAPYRLIAGLKPLSEMNDAAKTG